MHKTVPAYCAYSPCWKVLAILSDKRLGRQRIQIDNQKEKNEKHFNSTWFQLTFFLLCVVGCSQVEGIAFIYLFWTCPSRNWVPIATFSGSTRGSIMQNKGEQMRNNNSDNKLTNQTNKQTKTDSQQRMIGRWQHLAEANPAPCSRGLCSHSLIAWCTACCMVPCERVVWGKRFTYISIVVAC